MAFFLRYLCAIAAVLAIAYLFDRYVSSAASFWWLVIAFAVQALFSAVHLSRLHHWAALPRNRDVPSGLGPWRIAFERLARFARQESDARAELLNELERIHAAVDRLPDGLVVLDRFDHVVWANDAAEALHGIFGTRRPIHHFIRQPELAPVLAGDGAPGPIQVQLPSHPGSTFEIRMHESVNDQKLLITRDVTDQAKLNAMRSDFVANVSHEIRTPLTVIAGFAETLLTLDLDKEERRQHLEAILRQSTTMQHLVEDLLTLSSLESSLNGPEDEAVDIHAMLRALFEEAQALSSGRHVFALKLEGVRKVRAVASELESATRNLLSNAVRYTPDGGSIALEWIQRDDEGWITVRDTGIGIAADQLPGLFSPFRQVEPHLAGDRHGMGLGLAISRDLVDL
ncbi:MAG: phosphate regulon sensor protein PhoR, partial [Gammaproteobacteria bacterium]